MTASTLGNYVPANFPNISDPRALGKFISAELDKISNTVSLANQQLASHEAAWTAYTPVVTAGSGTFTAVSAVGSYHQIGKTVHVHFDVTITTNGTAGGTVLIALPVPNNTAKRMAFGVRIGIAVPSMGIANLNGLTAPNVAAVVRYDNTYPGADGAIIFGSGTYEAA